jgi:hypothetical protein
MTERDETIQHEYDSTTETAGRRGKDDRRGRVDPKENPAPQSPDPDREEIRKGEEILSRIKAY